MNWFESISETRARWLAAALFAVLATVALAPFLLFGKVFLPTDAATYYYPLFEFYSTALKTGESFLWNPYLFSGFPNYLSQSAGFFDPLNLTLFSLLDPFVAYHVRLALDLFLTMLFSYLAARALSISRPASLLVGPGYLLAFNWGYLSNPVILNSVFLIPFLMWVAIRIGGNRHPWRWALLSGVGIGWSMLSGYAQITVYASALFALFLLADLLFVRRSREWQAYARTAGVLLLAGFVALIIALPQIAPALSFSDVTLRAQGLSYQETQAKVINPGDAALFLFPDHLYFPYISGGRRPLFVGALLFFLALTSFGWLARKVWRRDVLTTTERRTSVLAGLFAFCFFSAVAYSPLYYLLQQLPVFSYFRYPYRWMYVGVWFLALLGAWGVDRVRAGEVSWLRRFSTILAAFTAMGVAVVLALNFFGEAFWSTLIQWIQLPMRAFVYGRFGFTKGAEHYADAFDRGLHAWQESVSLMEPAFLVAFVSLLVAVALFFMVARRYISTLSFARSAVVLSFATFLCVFASQWPQTLPNASVRLHTPVVAGLEGLIEGEYRTFPFMLGESFSRRVPPQYTLSVEELRASAELQFATGWPNANMFAGILSADGYDQFVSTELLTALGALGSTHGAQEATRGLTLEERSGRLLSHLDLLGSMSVKYVLAGTQLQHRDLELRREVVVTRYEVPVYVYENKLALPRAYFAKRTENRPEDSLHDLLTAGVPFGEVVYLDCDSCEQFTSSVVDTLTLVGKENGYVAFKTYTRGTRWLVVTESNLPGWVARRDGTPVNIVPANSIYMAVEIPPGEHEVVLEYRGIHNERRWLELLGIIR